MNEPAKTTRAELESQLAEIRAERESLTAQLAESQAQIQRYQEETPPPDEASERVALEDELTKAREELAAIEHHFIRASGEATEALAQLQSSFEGLRDSLAPSATPSPQLDGPQPAELQARIAELEAENESLVASLTEARREADAKGDIDDTADTFDSNLSDIRAELAGARDELTQVREETDTLRTQLAEQMHQFETARESLGSYLADLRSQVRAAEPAVAQPPSEPAPPAPPQAPPEAAPAPTTSVQVEADARTVSEGPSEAPLAPEPAATAEADPDQSEGGPRVTAGDVMAADFDDVREKIVFVQALTDIASHDVTTRSHAADAIAQVRHPLSLEALTGQLARDPSPQVRQACVRGMAAMRTPEALAAINLALTDEAPSVRLTALWTIYHTGDDSRAATLISMFSDPDKEVRRRAVTCAGWLAKELASAQSLAEHEVFEVLIDGISDLLNDEAPAVQEAASEAMKALTGDT